MCQLFETKGCHTFSCQERNCILAVANKRKISFYLWLGKGFDHLSDGLLNDVPKIVYCLPQSVIVGYKRCYEVIDVPPISVSKSGLNALGSICTYIQTRTYVLTSRTYVYADDNHVHLWTCISCKYCTVSYCMWWSWSVHLLSTYLISSHAMHCYQPLHFFPLYVIKYLILLNHALPLSSLLFYIFTWHHSTQCSTHYHIS